MSRQNHSTTNQVSFLINPIEIHILRQGPIRLVLRARRTIPQIWTTLIWTGLIRHEMERGPSLNQGPNSQQGKTNWAQQKGAKPKRMSTQPGKAQTNFLKGQSSSYKNSKSNMGSTNKFEALNHVDTLTSQSDMIVSGQINQANCLFVQTDASENPSCSTSHHHQPIALEKEYVATKTFHKYSLTSSPPSKPIFSQNELHRTLLDQSFLHSSSLSATTFRLCTNFLVRNGSTEYVDHLPRDSRWKTGTSGTPKSRVSGTVGHGILEQKLGKLWQQSLDDHPADSCQPKPNGELINRATLNQVSQTLPFFPPPNPLLLLNRPPCFH
ncbi:uncharacterized protein LOC124887296 [Capsicum annuum]|uniref:uncharacterized protein LOC124887296 n=1 Tax=Capsicum annuum TaxID=4072 RepID=UPI001FB1269D|nr:uncharacterized protein LOC124887296 [Capsicum annuum]